MTLYLVEHEYLSSKDVDEVKIIGIYSSNEKVENVLKI